MSTVAASNGNELGGKLSRLVRFNLIMGFLHLLQGILMIVLSNDTTYPIFTNFLGFNLETLSLSPQTKLLYELRFGPAVAAFLLISAVAHLPGHDWEEEVSGKS